MKAKDGSDAAVRANARSLQRHSSPRKSLETEHKLAFKGAGQ